MRCVMSPAVVKNCTLAANLNQFFGNQKIGNQLVSVEKLLSELFLDNCSFGGKMFLTKVILLE